MTIHMPESDTCWAKAQSCLYKYRVVQNGKIALWLMGTIGTALLPIPYWNAAISGTVALIGVRELGKTQRPPSLSNGLTGRHLAVGTIFVAASCYWAQVALFSGRYSLAAVGYGAAIWAGHKIAHA